MGYPRLRRPWKAGQVERFSFDISWEAKDISGPHSLGRVPTRYSNSEFLALGRLFYPCCSRMVHGYPDTENQVFPMGNLFDR